jgi:hypothetical protein
MEDQNGLFYFL